MTVKIEKPILIAGVSISFLLWFWQRIQTSFSHLGEFSLWGLMAFGIIFWLWKPKLNSTPSQQTIYTPISKIELDKAFSDCENLINQLTEEKGFIPDFVTTLNHLKTSLSRHNLQIAIAGRNKSGKTNLTNILASKFNINDVNFIDVNSVEINDLSNELNKKNQGIKINPIILNSDLILFVINGDLNDSEWQMIKKISSLNQRLLLIFNQKDRYIEDEQIIILTQLKEKVKSVINSGDIIAITTNPTQIKVKKHQGEGIFEEWKENPEPEFTSLIESLNNIITQEKSSLILSTIYRQTITLKNEIKNSLNEIRKTKSIPIIEQYQLIASAAAFANPVSSLDLLATAAINTQMLIDLSDIYQQKISLEKAKIASVTIGKLMVKLGIVEFSTQTLGSILKSNVITYIAGATVQAVSAAYLTRIAGLSLIEYFQAQENNDEEGLNLDKLKQKIQWIFEENKRSIFLQNFVKNTIEFLQNSQKKEQTFN